MFSSEAWLANPSSDFYNGVATQSLRFDDGSSAYLSRTFVTPTNSQKWCLNVWVKRGNLGTNFTIIGQDYVSTSECFLRFDSNDRLEWQHYSAGGVTQINDLTTTQVFRDTSAWYNIHLIFDTVDRSGDDRQQIWVNGEQVTSFVDTTRSSETSVWNTARDHHIGQRLSSGYYDGYMSEINFVDGLALDPTYFGQTKNGVWIAKNPVVSDYGNNGFRLQFENTGTGTTAEGTTATTNIGDDSSGNGHNFSVNNINSYDVLPDSPERNFCTFNSIGRRYGQSYVATFSEGNLKAVGGGNATHIWGSMAINQIASQGGVYFEVRIDSLDAVRTYMGVIGDNGVDNKNSNSNGASYTYPIKGVISSSLYGYFGTSTASINLTSGNTAFSAGDVVGIAILSDGKFFMHRNGTYLKNTSGNTGDPSTGTNEIATIDLTEGDWVPYAGYNSSFSINFGQDGSFSGNETSGGYQDGNGIGDFMFAVPTNCFAICTSNMAETTISPNSATQADDYFNTVLYTGNATDNRSITGVGFQQPEFVWLKARSSAQSHELYDVVRGATKRLRSDLAEAEANAVNNLQAFESDGFEIGDATSINGSGITMVAWNWKAGGTAVSNTDGSITSSVSANTTSGFSIVSYTGNATASTIGHGLNKTPAMIIVKERGGARPWVIYHASNTSAPETDYLRLNETNGTADYDMWNDTAPTSSVFSVSSYDWVNNNASPFIAYCFAEVEGYSKFGSYTGNGNADGPMIFTSFEPSFIMTKETSATSSWNIYDNVRSNDNPATELLIANSSNSEGTGTDIDIVSNGFKIRSTSGNINTSGNNYIYMGFAQQPFRYANAR